MDISEILESSSSDEEDGAAAETDEEEEKREEKTEEVVVSPGNFESFFKDNWITCMRKDPALSNILLSGLRILTPMSFQTGSSSLCFSHLYWDLWAVAACLLLPSAEIRDKSQKLRIGGREEW